MQTAFYNAMITAIPGKTEACFELNKATIVAQGNVEADSITGSDGFKYHSTSGLFGLTPQSLTEGIGQWVGRHSERGRMVELLLLRKITPTRSTRALLGAVLGALLRFQQCSCGGGVARLHSPGHDRGRS